MPSKSKSQQRFFGMVHACQKHGKCASSKVRKTAHSISDTDAEHFAKTSHAGLPEKVEQFSFKEFLLIQESSALWNYMKQIEHNPNADDLKTLIKMLAKNPNMMAWFSDMWPTIERIMAKLSPEEQQEIQSLLGHVNSADPRFQTHSVVQGWKPFTSTYDFERWLVQQMEKDPPNVHSIMKVVQDNEHLFRGLDPDFQQQFIDWLEEQERIRQQQPTMGQAFGNALGQAFQEPEQ